MTSKTATKTFEKNEKRLTNENLVDLVEGNLKDISFLRVAFIGEKPTTTQRDVNSDCQDLGERLGRFMSEKDISQIRKGFTGVTSLEELLAKHFAKAPKFEVYTMQQDMYVQSAFFFGLTSRTLVSVIYNSERDLFGKLPKAKVETAEEKIMAYDRDFPELKEDLVTLVTQAPSAGDTVKRVKAAIGQKTAETLILGYTYASSALRLNKSEDDRVRLVRNFKELQHMHEVLTEDYDLTKKVLDKVRDELRKERLKSKASALERRQIPVEDHEKAIEALLKNNAVEVSKLKQAYDERELRYKEESEQLFRNRVKLAKMVQDQRDRVCELEEEARCGGKLQIEIEDLKEQLNTAKLTASIQKENSDIILKDTIEQTLVDMRDTEQERDNLRQMLISSTERGNMLEQQISQLKESQGSNPTDEIKKLESYLLEIQTENDHLRSKIIWLEGELDGVYQGEAMFTEFTRLQGGLDTGTQQVNLVFDGGDEVEKLKIENQKLQKLVDDLKEGSKLTVYVPKPRMTPSDYGNRWFGFFVNTSLKTLVSTVGETEDIIGIREVKDPSSFLRIKACLRKICAITKSRQYIWFCRTQYGKPHVSGGENPIVEFAKCFLHGVEKNMKNYLEEVTSFCQSTGSKSHIFAYNNPTMVERLLSNTFIDFQ